MCDLFTVNLRVLTGNRLTGANQQGEHPDGFSLRPLLPIQERNRSRCVIVSVRKVPLKVQPLSSSIENPNVAETTWGAPFSLSQSGGP